jgi:transposase
MIINAALSKKERKRLKQLQKVTKDARTFKKIAVILGLDLGISYSILKLQLALDESTIRRYEKKYLEKGFDQYLMDDYVPYEGKLNNSQLNQLIDELSNTIYKTSQEVCDWIQSEFKVEYHSQGLVHLLHRLGFVYKKPKLMPAKADAQKQEKFLQFFTQLQSDLKKNEALYFADAVHAQHNTQLAYGWIRKGEEKWIKSNTGRSRININGVLEPKTKEVIYTEDQTINAESTIKLFDKIEAKNQEMEKIYIIADNARYYKNKRVTEYLDTSKIELVFLPPYSPNLNLIERLWKFMKKKVTYNKYYETFSEFRDKILDFFENLHIYREELDRLLTSNFEILDST